MERELQDDSYVLGLNNWRIRVTFGEMGVTDRDEGLEDGEGYRISVSSWMSSV